MMNTSNKATDKVADKVVGKAAGRAADFAPDLLSIQERPPARLPRTVAYVTTAVFCALALWAVFGKLDIVASAEGRLVPRNYSRVLQPAEPGIVREVLVREGEHSQKGRLDRCVADSCEARPVLPGAG